MPIQLIGDIFMQLDAFFMGLIQVSLLDGLALALGAAFIIATICGIVLTRRTGLNITWGLGTIASLIIGVISGLAVMAFVGFLAIWAGSGIHGLSGADLNNWTEITSTAFGSSQIQGIILAYVGALAGIAMGYGIAIRPKEEATRFGIGFSILGVCALAIGFTLTMLPTILTLSTLLLFGIDGLFSLLFILAALWVRRKRPAEDTDYYVTQTEVTE